MRSYDRRSGYISFDTALAHHGVLDDVTHLVRIAGVRGNLRGRDAFGHIVEWVFMPDDLWFGIMTDPTQQLAGFDLAEPEKALCDLMWLCESRAWSLPVDSLRLDELDEKRLEDYAARMLLDPSRLHGGSGR